MAESRADIYARITAEIVSAIQEGAGQWRMPWHHEGDTIARPRNVCSDKAYRGINILALWVAARRSRYASGIWGTYRQWSQLGCQVSRGEKATSVVFWKDQRNVSCGTAEGDDESDPNHEDHEDRPRFFARGYCVFNANQIESYVADDVPRLPETERIARADAFFAALGIPIVTGADRACYRTDIDTVFMPAFERFLDAAAYYSCLGHETAHGTGASCRLDRDLTGRFGSASYAMDEVVAELTSSFIMADLGIAHRPRPEHAAYIDSWIKILKSDPRAIFTAAGKAQAAADWMHARQPSPDAAQRVSHGEDLSPSTAPLNG